MIQYLNERRKELGVGDYDPVDLKKVEKERNKAREKVDKEQETQKTLTGEAAANEVKDIERRLDIKANAAEREKENKVASVGTSASPVVVTAKPPAGGVAGSTGAAGAAGPAGAPFSITNVPIVGGQPGVDEDLAAVEATGAQGMTGITGASDVRRQLDESKKGLTTGGTGGGLLGSLKQGLQSLIPSGDTIKSAVSGISEAVAKGRAAAGAGPVKTGTGEQIA